MAELDFIETDTGTIVKDILSELESGVNEQLYPGDERRIFGEALAGVLVSVFNSVNDACRQKMLRYARGKTLDALGETRGVKRLPAEKATTTLRFSINSVFGQNIVIPSGVRVTGDLKRYFVTDSTAVITSGQLYTDVSATAEESGSEYNGILAGGLNAVVDVSVVPLIDSVTNTTSTSGGGNAEDDDTYRERIRVSENALSTAGTAKAYRYYAMSADPAITDAVVTSEDETIERTLTVYSAHAFLGGDQLQPDTLTIEDVPGDQHSESYSDGLLTITLTGASASLNSIDISIKRSMKGVVRIVPICAGGELPTEDQLQGVYDKCTAEDVKPLTDMVIVEEPDVEEYDIELTYYTTKADESQVVAMVEGENGAIDRYNLWQSSQFEQDINPDYLRKLILSPDWSDDLIGAERVTIVKPVYTALDKTTIAKFSGNITVSHVAR